MGCIKVNNFIQMHDKPQTFQTIVDKKTVHGLVLYGVAICVCSVELTTGEYGLINTEDKIYVKRWLIAFFMITKI